MSADPPSSQANDERFRHWITDVHITPGNSDPDCKFSARMFVDDELVCNLPAINSNQPLQWSGLLFCDTSSASTVALRLCKTTKGRPRYFNFPPFIISEADEETGEVTLELAEAAWVVTIKLLTPVTANQLFVNELEKFDLLDGVYDSIQPEATIKYLYKYSLQFASLVVKALPESTAKVSFLIFMKAWEQLLNQQTQLDETVQAILHGLTRVRDIIDMVSKAPNPILASFMSQSSESIYRLLAILEDVSIYIYNQHTINDLVHIPSPGAEMNDTYDVEVYLTCLEELQRVLYSSWSSIGPSPSDAHATRNETTTTPHIEHNAQNTSSELIQTDWYEIVNLLRPINPSGYDLDQACLHGTREPLLNRILTWTQNREESESFMWISGQAGMGKTSVATSLCQRLDSIRALAGSFFCRRDNSNLNDSLLLFNNLICELAMNCPAYAHEVTIAIRDSPKLCSSQLSLRYESLIKKPLQKLECISMPNTLIIVVDGLDECGDYIARGKTLKKLDEMSGLVPWLKIIVTGRPVPDIQHHFYSNCPHQIVIHLHDYDATPDIRAYIGRELAQVAETENWPSTSINKLCSMAQGVFLWAALAVNYINDFTLPALPRLQKVLNNQKSPVTDFLDVLYTRALQTAMGKNQDDTRDAYLQCIAAVLVISERGPFTISDLQCLLVVAGQIDQLTPEQMINNLSPLLLVLDERRIPFHHPSFKDFMTDASRSGQFHIRLDQYEAEPALFCLQIMQRDLCFNICELETSHWLNNEFPDLKRRIDSHIGSALKYACAHWINHFISCPTQTLVQATKKFMEGPQLMYWIEALSLLSCIDVAIEGFSKLAALELTRFNGWGVVLSWAKDAHRFLLSFYDPITASTPHIYVSALAFAPRKSLLALRMRPHFPNTIEIIRGGDLQWHPCVKTTIHSHTIQTLSISPDGRRLVVGYPDGLLAIWDQQTGACISKSLAGHQDVVTCTTFSPDGSLVASCSHDATICIWKVTSGLQDFHKLCGHSGPVHSVAFSPNSSLIASGSSDKTIRLWHPNTMRAIHGPYIGHLSRVTSVAFSADGTKLASGSWDRTIRVWLVDVGSSQLANNPLVINVHSDSVTCLSFSPDGSKIASGSTDKTLQIWDAQTGVKPELHTSPAKHFNSITSIAYSPSGKLVASCSLDGVVQLWDATTLIPYSKPFGHSSPANTIAFSPDGSYIVSGSTDMTTRVWEINSCPKPMTMKPLAHSNTVRSVATTCNGTRIVSASSDRTVQIWDAQTGVPVCLPLTGHSRVVHCVAISPDGSQIVSGSSDNFIRLWDTATYAYIRSFQCSSAIHCTAFSPDGAQIAFGTGHNDVYLWDLTEWKMIKERLQGHSGAVFSVNFSPDGTCVASASQDYTVIIWDIRSHSRLGKPLSGHTDWVRSVAFSPCGTQLISGSHDNTLRVWDRETGSIVYTLTGHSNWVMSVAFSPDGSCIASGSNDNTVRLWNVKTGKLIGQPFTEHSGCVWSIAFSSDGNYLISGSDDKTIRVRNVAALYPVVVQEIEHPLADTFYWPSNPYELSSHPKHPGWVTHGYDSLAFWLPTHYEQYEKFLDSSQQSSSSPVCLNYSKFLHGTGWTNVPSTCNYNSMQ
ncbi:unnamed protein product [Rhizoctonia solani]|nr:unnamed protein product [Rhizoctonia solani]